MRERAKDVSSADQGQDQQRQLESGGRFKAISLSVNLKHKDYCARGQDAPQEREGNLATAELMA